MKTSTVELLAFALGITVSVIILDLNQQLQSKTKELLEVKKVVLQLDEDLTAKEEMIISLNEELDIYYMYDKIVKDLRWSK